MANVFCANRFLCSEFFFLVKTVTEISGSQFLKKDHILTYVTGFLASGNHFFQFYLDISQLLSVAAVYSSTEAYFSVNPSFRPVKSSFLSTESSISLLSDFFVRGTIGHKFFQKFCKVEAAFLYSGNVFFNIFHPANENGFCA